MSHLMLPLLLSCGGAQSLLFHNNIIAHHQNRNLSGRMMASNNINDGHHSAAGSNWRIWSVIEQLESKKKLDSDLITSQVIHVLHQWASEWSGKAGWQTLLNKKSLLHEVEESIISLQILNDWLEKRSDNNPVTLVDVCCGKGITSMLASYIFCNKTATDVSDVIMLDKQDINWSHITASNEKVVREGANRPLIETWCCNLHEIDRNVERLEAKPKQLAFIGIHLCKQLSPACVSVVNALGPEKAPFLCLAPCCLPLAARNFAKTSRQTYYTPREMKKTIIEVRKYEPAEERQSRKDANQRRLAAKKRTFFDEPCYLCSENHPVQKCGLLPPDECEQMIIFERAALMNRPCWKCGEMGHQKANCPNENMQESSKPSLSLPPTVELNLIAAFSDENKTAFDCYCDLLASAIDRDSVRVVNSGLTNINAHYNNDANRDNWNAQRKSLFIVASS